jgi:hypothetical protein
MLSGEAGWPDSQQLLEVLLHEAVERRLARPSRLVDPTADYHSSRPAGGRVSGDSRRGRCPSRPAGTWLEVISENFIVAGGRLLAEARQAERIQK